MAKRSTGKRSTGKRSTGKGGPVQPNQADRRGYRRDLHTAWSTSLCSTTPPRGSPSNAPHCSPSWTHRAPAHRIPQQPRIRLERPDSGALDVVVLSAATGPAHHMLLNPDFARDGVGFLDGDTVTLHSSSDWLPTYLPGARRHAIVMRVRG